MATNSSSEWILKDIHPFNQHDVGSIVPPVFEAYARVFHPAYLGSSDIPVSWSEVARTYGRVAHPDMEWEALVGSLIPAVEFGSGPQYRHPNIGMLPVSLAKILSDILKPFSTGVDVMYAAWTGYSDLKIENAELMKFPERPMYVKSGHLRDAENPFGRAGRTANLWWSSDQKWCVGTDVDLMTTYVGGSKDCIEAIVNNGALEAMPVTSDQSITWDADTLNPPPN